MDFFAIDYKRFYSLFVTDENYETPKPSSIGNTTPQQQQHTDYEAGIHDSKENLVDENYTSEDCSAQEYEIMKVRKKSCRIMIVFLKYSYIAKIFFLLLFSYPQDNLLLYNHARLMAQDNHSKEYLVSIMFSHYDQNGNGDLEKDELEQVAEREELEQLSKGCSLGHMIGYDDADRDGKLNINEFYMAFSKLYSKSLLLCLFCDNIAE